VNSIAKVQAKESRLGEFYTIFLCLSMNHMNDGMNYMHVLALIVFFHNFGKSPGTAWRAAHSRQATHALLYGLGFLERNRLAAHSRPPGDA